MQRERIETGCGGRADRQQAGTVAAGLWYGTLTTPVPSLMVRVRCDATAMKISGEALISVPAE